MNTLARGATFWRRQERLTTVNIYAIVVALAAGLAVLDANLARGQMFAAGVNFICIVVLTGSWIFARRTRELCRRMRIEHEG